MTARDDCDPAKTGLPSRGRPWIARCLCAALLVLAGPALAGPSLLVDLDTGKVIRQEEAFTPWYPASLTKLMTVYVTFRAIEAGELQFDSPVRVSERASREPPSRMGYRPGSVLTVDNAVKILMVKSANDVASALAESVDGSRAAFVERMNAEARRLGMEGTRFVNAHGLHAEEQVTTARDLALLALALRRDFPDHARYFSLEALVSGEEVMENNNSLIGRFEGADGMKTGYTCPSGFNLIATATRDGRSLMAVVIGEHTVEARADKAADLLALGFGASGEHAPHLTELRPSGEEPPRATDLRPVICTEAHWKAVTESRGPAGRPVFRSPHLSEPEHLPVAVAVSLGGASGPEAAAARNARAPMPTPRPDHPPRTAAPAQAAPVAERFASGVPIPTPRPADMPAAAAAADGGQGG